MIPELPKELYNRRHYGTPEIVKIISINYVVFSLAVQVFVDCSHINWFFWIVLAGLAWYNYSAISRNLQDFNKKLYIAYGISVAGLGVMYYLLAYVAKSC